MLILLNYLEIIEQQKITAQIDFLMNLKILKNLSYHCCKNLFFRLALQQCQRNAIIFKENDKPDDFYIIKMGYFKVIKEIILMKKNSEENEMKINDSIEFQNFFDKMNIKIKEKFTNNLRKKFEVCILGPGQTFGEEDLINEGSTRETTVKCESETGILYKLSKQVNCK